MIMSILITLLHMIILLKSCISAVQAAGIGLCQTSCGSIPIHYPFGIEDGCGSPYYRNMLVCSNDTAAGRRQLHLRTPSGTYPVSYIDYADPHLVVTDPSMWSCINLQQHQQDSYFDHDTAFTDHSAAAANSRRPAASTPPPFSLDTSTRFSLSPKNDYLFFNCSEESVIIEPRPSFCERFPDRCDSVCDSAGYLCRNLPECPNALTERGTSCCSYYPKALESLRLLLRHCASYTSVYWRTVAGNLSPYDQVPEYGIRVDFEIPVTTKCLQCRDEKMGGGGSCGYDTESRSFLCLCEEAGNSTSSCADIKFARHKKSVGVIVGFSMGLFASLLGVGALVWYLTKIKRNKVVNCGVQSNENRLF